MEKPVIISISGTQTNPDGVGEEIEFVTYGSLRGGEGQGYSVSYEESAITGMDGTTTTFQIGKDRITMLRKGSLNSEMVFAEGEQHVSLYDTGMGGLMVSVRTKKAWADIGQDGGNMELLYRIEVENMTVGENRFRIQVREQIGPHLQ